MIATRKADLIITELDRTVRKLDVTREYFLDLVSQRIVDMPTEVMDHLNKATHELEGARKDYEDYKERIGR